jgi:hypothetical protein
MNTGTYIDHSYLLYNGQGHNISDYFGDFEHPMREIAGDSATGRPKLNTLLCRYAEVGLGPGLALT